MVCEQNDARISLRPLSPFLFLILSGLGYYYSKAKEAKKAEISVIWWETWGMRVHYSFQFTFVKMEEEAFLGGKKINNDVKVSFFRQKKK